jgi:DNA-binding transcriptional LysR family regulator
LRAVARTGSFLAAGRELGCATSTLSRRVARLEAAVGAPLFDRHNDGVRPTETGRRLDAVAEDLEMRLRAGMRDLSTGGAELRGTVRVTAADGFAEVLLSTIAAFRAQHPGVSFELALDGRKYDLARREADLALRTRHGGEGTLVYVPITRLAFGLFASRDYLRQQGPPRAARDLKTHAFVGLAPPGDRMPAMIWLRELGASNFSLLTTGVGSVVGALRAGLGISAVPESLAEGLEPVLPSLRPEPMHVYLVTHREARRLPHVQAFGRALTEQIRARGDAASNDAALAAS